MRRYGPMHGFWAGLESQLPQVMMGYASTTIRRAPLLSLFMVGFEAYMIFDIFRSNE